MKRNIHFGLAAAMLALAVFTAYLAYAKYELTRRIDYALIGAAILSVVVGRKFFVIAKK